MSPLLLGHRRSRSESERLCPNTPTPTLGAASGQKGESVHLSVKRSSLFMWRIMFSSRITDGNIKIGTLPGGFNGNACAQDLTPFKSLWLSHIYQALEGATVQIIVSVLSEQR